ncbi:LAMI_0D11782g1_1 [Lachancea mirantina]|uniref:Transcription elongation factor SPT5 n=1 Tax=Lachancea mirantina TaxID=1230905 RepID=A0A1G4JFF0_9SACH|nr:LAMI_0D11782g1_1 [Lachancea mirantina]
MSDQGHSEASKMESEHAQSENGLDAGLNGEKTAQDDGKTTENLDADVKPKPAGSLGDLPEEPSNSIKTDRDDLINGENAGQDAGGRAASEKDQETHEDGSAEKESDDNAQGPEGKENDGNEDEDDEDEDDEDEDDDEEGPRKKQRRERNRFLDIEAEVSDDDEDEEDEEDSELVREGFITRGDEEDEETTGPNRDDRLHRQLDQNLNKSSEEDAQKLAKELRERYGRSSSKQYRAAAQDGYVPQRFLLPSVDTATIWGVRCRPGREKELVRKLLKKKFNLDKSMGNKKLKILAIFQRDNYSGRIYIEAPKQSVIEKFTNGVPDIYPSQKLLIPVQELPLLLKPDKSDDVKLEEGSYVRVRRGIYKGDLAVIDQISENNLEVLLKIVPRLDYGKFDEVDEKTNTRKQKRPVFAQRPPPQLFNPTMALRMDQANLYKRDDRHFTYRNEDYVDGYLYKSFRIQYLETKNIQPTVEELARFGTKDGTLDLTSISQTIKKAKAARVMFQPGDRVEILNGEQRGSRGVVARTSTDIIAVRLPQLASKALEFPVSSLRKIFEAGDHVTVVGGDHQGDAGLVLVVKNGQVTFVSDQTRANLTITANNLTKSMDSTPTSSEYALHDIVELSAKNVACVIQAGHDIFKILDDNGKVSTITKGSILRKIDSARSRSTTVDAQGREIKIGDTIREKVGARREGQVLYIQTQQVFVVSKKITENAGVFVVNPMNVEAVASKENVLAGMNSLDLSKMNPDIANKMRPPQKVDSAIRGGRDVALGKTVRVRAAGYKGQLGIVKDVNGEKATIELHSKSKNITVDKRKLMYYNKEGGDGITYDELVNRRGRTPSNRIGPSYVSTPRSMAPPVNGSGPSGPALAGGMTPGWNSFDGGKTPAVTAHGGGGASAWGGASTWGGQGGGASTWGGNGGASAWGGQGTGATSTWGGASAWGNKSTWGGASTWASGGESGATSAWGGGDKSNHGNASTWGNRDGGTSTWGGGAAAGGGNSTWGNDQGNKSAWGDQGNRSSYGGGSTWGGR